MDPLSLRTRRWYAIISSVLFVFVLAPAVFYASGYHVQGLEVVETGAIHVSVAVPDAMVSLNGVEVGKSGLLTRAFFLDNLKPGAYTLEARAEGYRPWVKELIVAPKVVTDVPAFLVPTEFMLTKVSFPSVALDNATSTIKDTEGGLALSIEDGVAILRWTRAPESVPAAFCIEPGTCTLAIVIAQDVLDARLFGGGVVYDTAEGVFISEADIKKPRIAAPILDTPGAIFRIDRNRLYLKTATSSYEVSGF